MKAWWLGFPVREALFAGWTAGGATVFMLHAEWGNAVAAFLLMAFFIVAGVARRKHGG